MINRRSNIFLVCSSILTTLLILIAYTTQAHGIQIIFIQPVYWILDTEWGEIRTICLLLAAFGGGAALLLDGRVRVKNSLKPAGHQLGLNNKILCLLGVMGGGLILSLLVFYAHSCCDNPVTFYLGFPLSWLRGTAPVQHYLPIPIVPYLIQNLQQIQWYVDGISLMVDLVFWGNVSVIIFIIRALIHFIILSKRNN